MVSQLSAMHDIEQNAYSEPDSIRKTEYKTKGWYQRGIQRSEKSLRMAVGHTATVSITAYPKTSCLNTASGNYHYKKDFQWEESLISPGPTQ